MFDEALNATFGPKPENNGDEISHRSWPNYLRAAQDLNEINGTQGTPRCFLSSTSILANTSSRSGSCCNVVIWTLRGPQASETSCASAIGSGGLSVLVVFYTLALFKLPPLHVIHVIEHFMPRLIHNILIHDISIENMFALRLCPKE